MISFQLLGRESIPWAELDAYKDRVVYQRLPWLSFLEATQNATIVVIKILKNNVEIGYFTGLGFSRFGVRILGSPFNGWETNFMGFNLNPETSRSEVIPEILNYIFKDLKYHFCQINDLYLDDEQVDGVGFAIDHWQNFEVDLSRDCDEIFAKMNSDCRRRIRKADREGVVFEEAPIDGFSEKYYAQLIEVFSKHGILPTHSKDHVDKLIEHLYPTGDLLLLQATTPEGICIATSMILMDKNLAHWLGGGSLKAYLHKYSPNEGLMWFGFKKAKELGAIWFDMGGWAPYKKKYATDQVVRSCYMKSDPEILVKIKKIAQKSWYKWHELKSRNKVKQLNSDIE